MKFSSPELLEILSNTIKYQDAIELQFSRTVKRIESYVRFSFD